MNNYNTRQHSSDVRKDAKKQSCVESPIKSYRVCDGNREIWKTIAAASLKELLEKSKDKLFLEGDLKLLLEADGTEVDDEEYFQTLSPNTSTMIMNKGERWKPEKKKIEVDETDNLAFGEESVCDNCGVSSKVFDSPKRHTKPTSVYKHLKQLIDSLQNNIAEMALLGEEDLDRLADLNPSEFNKVYNNAYNRRHLEFIREASGRLLVEKRQAQEAMQLLKLYADAERKEKKSSTKRTQMPTISLKRHKVSEKSTPRKTETILDYVTSRPRTRSRTSVSSK